MSHIELAPTLDQALKGVDFQKVFSAPGFIDLIQKANQKYLYWDTFKYRQFPAGVSALQAWGVLRLLRQGNNRHSLQIKDKSGRSFTYSLTDEVFKSLNELDRSAGALLLSTGAGELPSKERFIISSLMEEAIASSQLEGAATTRQVAKEMLRSGREPTSLHERMIFNNWRTMQHIRSMATAPLTADDILQIQALVTEGTLKDPEQSGALRTSDDIVVEYRGEEVHWPPSHTLLGERLQAFCDFANSDDGAGWIHPFIKASVLHFWLGYDHPFVDGNGRTARAIFYWYLLSRKYWIFEYLAISRYFLRAPGQYVRAYIYSEIDDNDLTYFIMHSLRVVRLALHDVHRYIREKQAELAAANIVLRKHRGLNGRQRSLLYHALNHAGAEYTIDQHRNYHGIAYDSARNDLLGLLKKGFLERTKRSKAFLFRPSASIMEKLRTGTTRAGPGAIQRSV